MTAPTTSPTSLEDFWQAIRATGLPMHLFELARDEDLGTYMLDAATEDEANIFMGDITALACAHAQQEQEQMQEGVHTDTVTAHVRARQACTVAGLAAAEDIARVFDVDVQCTINIPDGGQAHTGDTIAALTGPRAHIVTLERTLLNLVSRLSGVATLTHTYVEAARKGSQSVHVLDTRKTTPGLRVLEKYAVRCGGGSTHRLGLHDALLIKDNHIAGLSAGQLAHFVRTASAHARATANLSFVMVEVDTLEQLRAIASIQTSPEEKPVDIVLLDNMSNDQLTQAVSIRNEHAPHLRLEASGGVTLSTITDIARTGVDRISVGALTHSATIVDIGLDIGL